MSPPNSSIWICINRCSSTVRYIRGACKLTVAKFLLVPGNAPPLLGRATAGQLGILKVGINYVTHQQLTIDKMLRQHPGIAKGIGCLKYVQVIVHIIISVTPVARKHSMVPFHLPDKVATARKLKREDVIKM